MLTYFSGRFEDPNKLHTDLRRKQNRSLHTHNVMLSGKEIQKNHVPTVLCAHLEEVFESLPNTHTEISFEIQEVWQQFSSCKDNGFHL